MRLIHKEQVLPRYSLGKIPFQPDIRIEYIIVVADDTVHPVADVETEFKRTHLVSPGIL